MRNWLAPVAALSFLVAAGSATADDVTGKVVELDVENAEIELDNGIRYSLIGAKYEGVSAGDTVKVEYADVEGDLQASLVVKVEG